MKTPKPITVNTGDASPVYRAMDKFFESIIEKIEPKPLKRPTCFEIRVYNLGKQIYGNEQYIGCDDMLHTLLYRDKVVAVVTETRTITNFVSFTFFQNLEGILKT